MSIQTGRHARRYPNVPAPDPEFYDYNPATTDNTSEIGNDFYSTNPTTQTTVSNYEQVLGNWGPPSTGIIGSELNAPLIGVGTDGNPLSQAHATAQEAYIEYANGGCAAHDPSNRALSASRQAGQKER